MGSGRTRCARLVVPALVAVSLAACSSARAPVDQRGDSASAAVAEEQAVAPVVAPDAARVPARYRVVRGDTLYSISFRYGLDYRDIARWNGIREPYVIRAGQYLRLQADAPPGRRAQPDAPRVTAQPPAAREPDRPAANAGPAPAPLPAGSLQWRWPTAGRVVHSDSPTAKKGVEIAGVRGQAVNAAAGGAVVYSGSGLLGYGRLIILKHSDTFLSAYAYNEQLLVAEGDQVIAGQQIATMGTDNDGRAVLHFEIRKDGKPVNPLEHLPREPRAGRT